MPRTARLMVVGDSIASGFQDDHTWRWWLYRHLTSTGTAVEFVGPHAGTFSMYEDPVLLAVLDGRPLPAGREALNPMTGPYRDGSFTGTGRHCARPGWTAHAAKLSVARHIAAGRPDFLLLQLGFNDLAMVGPPDQALSDLAAVIGQARAVVPDAAVLVADVTGSRAWGSEWFRASIEDYNARLPAVLTDLSTSRSPVRLVDVHSRFDPVAHSYDDIHPNPSGELVIAAAFADGLRAFGLGDSPLLPPLPPPSDLPLVEPTITHASSAEDGDIKFAWSRIKGASAYRVALRDVTLDEPRRLIPLPVLGDHWWARGLTAGHTYEFDVAAARGDRIGPSSRPIRLAASGQIHPLPACT